MSVPTEPHDGAGCTVNRALLLTVYNILPTVYCLPLQPTGYSVYCLLSITYRLLPTLLPSACSLLPTGYCCLSSTAFSLLPAVYLLYIQSSISLSPINVSAEPLDGAGPRKHRKAFRHAARGNPELSPHAGDVDHMLLIAPIKPTPSHQPVASNLIRLLGPRYQYPKKNMFKAGRQAGGWAAGGWGEREGCTHVMHGCNRMYNRRLPSPTVPRWSTLGYH